MTTTKRQKNINRVLRWLYWSKAKRQSVMARYDRWMLRRLARHGPGPEKSYAERTADKQLRIVIQRQNEEFAEEHPDFG